MRPEHSNSLVQVQGLEFENKKIRGRVKAHVLAQRVEVFTQPLTS